MSAICPYCERQCYLAEGQVGFCQMYTWASGQVVERFPHRYSCMYVNHVENVPFYHFQPGSRTFVLGGAGCNFDCEYCANAYVARSDPEPLLTYTLPPERVVALARQYGCHNIAFAINEPTVALPTLLELAPVAAAAGLPLGVLTNGYVPAEVAEEMARAFLFVNVSLKAITAAFYRDHTGVPDVGVVMRTIEIMRRHTHLEVSTPIVQGLNDADIPEIAAFLASVDPQVPWHVFRLLPEYKMAGYDRPPIEAVNAALEHARQKLPFIYFGNFVGSRWVSTLCPACGETVIERINLGGCTAKLRSHKLAGTACAACGHGLPITGGLIDWHSRDGAPWTSQ
ncbi:MAG: radical SAM protein [Anaerolineae bacterium]|nr:radical SAM protein [Anaerolineae bacterium]